MQLNKLLRFESLLLILIIAGFLVRLYRFDSPIADWHSWRQADTSAVSRNFVTGGFDLLHPRFDDLSNVASGLDNPQGFRFVEFPIYNFLQASFYKAFNILTIEQWGRMVSILASLTSAIFLYLIFSERKQKSLGILSAFFFLFIPFNIYYSRTILPDPLMVTATLGSIHFFQLWLNKASSKQSIYYLASLILTVAAFLLKPYAIFFTLPVFYLAYEAFGTKMLKKWQLWVYAIFAFIPLVLWRTWMANFPQGIPANTWLLNGNGIRFRPAFFRWIFYERLIKLISGYLGIAILIAGVVSLKNYKDKLFFLSFALSSFLYISVFATGNVQHDYYQILIMPTVSIFFALGAIYLYNFKYQKIEAGKIILALSLFSLFYFGTILVKDYFNINNPSIITAGAAVDRLTGQNAKIIANYNGDTSFLYQTKRKGWASFEKPLPEMVKMGAEYLVLVNPTKADLELSETYMIIDKTDKYVIFKLK